MARAIDPRFISCGAGNLLVQLPVYQQRNWLSGNMPMVPIGSGPQGRLAGENELCANPRRAGTAFAAGFGYRRWSPVSAHLLPFLRRDLLLIGGIDCHSEQW